jgi:hypothetical protein
MTSSILSDCNGIKVEINAKKRKTHRKIFQHMEAEQYTAV